MRSRKDYQPNGKKEPLKNNQDGRKKNAPLVGTKPSQAIDKQGLNKDFVMPRAKGHQVWLYGNHASWQALQNNSRKISRILVAEDQIDLWREKIFSLTHKIPSPEAVDKRDLERCLPKGAVHQGIALLADQLDWPSLTQIARAAKSESSSVIMVLDQVTDPHNVGAILRSAAAFGAKAVVVADRNSPEETGTMAKSASGALEVLPLIRVTNVVRALEELKQQGYWIAGMAGEATQTLAQQNLTGHIALVMGAEGEGLRRLTREHCDYLVKLPMSGLVESLNVSNAAAVALYELVRERDF